VLLIALLMGRCYIARMQELHLTLCMPCFMNSIEEWTCHQNQQRNGLLAERWCYDPERQNPIQQARWYSQSRRIPRNVNGDDRLRVSFVLWIRAHSALSIPRCSFLVSETLPRIIASHRSPYLSELQYWQAERILCMLVPQFITKMHMGASPPLHH